MSQNREHIKGATVFAALGDLDAAFIAEAEVDAAYLPFTRAEKRATRREARGESGFWGFVNTGWGAALVSMPVAICVLVGIIHAVNFLPPPNVTPEPGPGGTVESDEIPATGDILLPGMVSFAAEPADFTISTDLTLPEGATSFIATVTSREEGEGISLYHSWTLECLTDISWSGMTIFTEEAIQVPAREGERVSCQKKISLSLGLVPGIYRLHAMEHDGTEYRSVAFCEFAVDNEEGYYKTWTEADFENYASPDVVLSMSTDEEIRYGARQITVTFRGEKGMSSLCFPSACRLVKLDGTAGAGAAFAIADDSLSVAVHVDVADPDDLADLVPTTTQTYKILNPAALTPGRYRIYNRDHLGFVYATCEFEVVGEANVQMGWPGATEEESETDAATEPTTDETDITIAPTPENSTPAIYYMNGIAVDCGDGDNQACLVQEPEIVNDPFVYPAATTMRIPLFATLRTLGAEVGENANGIVTVGFRGNTFRVDLNQQTIRTEDGLYAMYMHADLAGTRPLLVTVTSEDVLLCQEPFGYVLSFFNSPANTDSLADDFAATGMNESKKEIYLEISHSLDIRVPKIVSYDQGTLPITYYANRPGQAFAVDSYRLYDLTAGRVYDIPVSESLQAIQPGTAEEYLIYTHNCVIPAEYWIEGHSYSVSAVSKGHTYGSETFTVSPADGTTDAPTGIPFTISTDYDTFPYGGDTITVIYRATEPGVAFTMGSMTLTRLSDGQEFVLDQPEDDDLLVPEDPSEYLEYRRTFWIADAESLTEGNYRLTATVRGQVVAMTDIYVVLPLPG